MVSYIRFLFFTSLILSLVSAKRYGPTVNRHGIKWVKPRISCLVYFPAPDLPLWDPFEQIGENLNLTVCHNNRTLFVQDEPLFPLPDPHIPPRLNAHQTSLSLTQFENEPLLDLSNLPSFELDYDRLVYPRDDPSNHYYNFHPDLTLDILGAGIAGYNTLMNAESQWVLKVKLKDHNSQGRSTTDPFLFNLQIEDVRLYDRGEYYTFPNLDGLKKCTLWSWRCEDFGDTPWYRYVLRRNFDRFGKIGSIRHMLLQRRETLQRKVGAWQAEALIVLVGSMVLSPVFYGIYQLVRKIHTYYEQNRAQELYWEIREEQGEGLLPVYEEEQLREFFDETEKDEVLSEKLLDDTEGKGSSSDEKPLAPVSEKFSDVSEK